MPVISAKLGLGVFIRPHDFEVDGKKFTRFTIETWSLTQEQAAKYGVIFVSTPRIREMIAADPQLVRGDEVGKYSALFNHSRRSLTWMGYFPYNQVAKPHPKGVSEEIDWRIERAIRMRVGKIRYVYHSAFPEKERVDQLAKRSISKNTKTGIRYTYSRGRRLLVTRVRANRKRFGSH